MSQSHHISSPVGGRRPRHLAAGPAFTQIGGWQAVCLLGRGRWADVFRARPTDCPADWPADYAVKMLVLTRSQPRLGLEQLEREARVGREVAHPHLVTVLGSHLSEPPYYNVMPYREGATLRDVLDRFTYLAVPHSLWIARQIAEALESLHARGWLHCDVNPRNVIVSPEGHATLLDLGLARRMGSLECAATAPVTGTLAYAAPEVISPVLGSDEKSDIYSVGITLFEMLVGRPPYATDDAGRLAVAHLQQSPPEIRSLLPHVPREVSRLVKRLLSKDPLRRPSADELVSLLTPLEIATFDDRHGGGVSGTIGSRMCEDRLRSW